MIWNKRWKENNDLVTLIMVKWSILKAEVEKMPEDKKKYWKNRWNIKVVEEILEFNKKIQPGGGLRILTPNQMLSRSPISLAQIKAGKNSENLKMKLDNYYILCTDQKNLQNNSIKV